MDSTSAEIFDLIIVGAGPSGRAVASRLARSKKRPSVLLVEAGGNNDDKSMTIDAEPWLCRLNPRIWNMHEHYADYKIYDCNIGTTRLCLQEHLNNSVVGFDRGKGSGGSSSINFSLRNVGRNDDFEEIADLLESYQPPVPAGFKKYISPSADNHGKDGPLKVGFPGVWEKSNTAFIDRYAASEYPVHPDLNSGNPLGLSFVPSTANKGARINAKALLTNAPNNLHVLVNTHIARVIFSPDYPVKTIGVETIDSGQVLAKHDVITSARALDSPKLLLFSGIGDAKLLKKLGIPSSST